MKMSATQFGILAANGDRRFVSDLRKGRAPRLDTVDRIDQWMLNYRRPHQAESDTSGDE
jgi:hypothetical protein